MRLKLGIVMGGLFLVALSFGQSKNYDFPDTPKNHWVYEIVADLRRTGILVGSADIEGHPRGKWSKYNEAVFVNAAASRFIEIVTTMRDDPSAHDEWRGNELTLWRKDMVRGADEIIRLIGFFSPEMNQLGIVPGEMTRKVREARAFVLRCHLQTTAPFEDVPASHWAAGAVESLRSEGILQGYPDGKFRG